MRSGVSVVTQSLNCFQIFSRQFAERAGKRLLLMIVAFELIARYGNIPVFQSDKNESASVASLGYGKTGRSAHVRLNTSL
jgi:hypothetical protein